MRTFNDTQGRQWSVEVNVGAIKRVKTLIGVDLLQTKDGQLLVDLADDPVKMADVLWAIIQPQAASRNITDEDFGAALGGDTIRVAVEVFVAELIDFFLKFQPPLGKTLKVMWDKLGEYQTKAGALTETKLSDPRIQQVIDNEWEKANAEIDARLNELYEKAHTTLGS
jgi:hypothetical protein